VDLGRQLERIDEVLAQDGRVGPRLSHICRLTPAAPPVRGPRPG
jgi:hypothetical protein